MIDALLIALMLHAILDRVSKNFVSIDTICAHLVTFIATTIFFGIWILFSDAAKICVQVPHTVT